MTSTGATTTDAARRIALTGRILMTGRIVLAGTLLAGLSTMVWIWSAGFKGCEVMEFSDGIKAAIAEQSDIVKWTLTLAVGLIGLFGSIIIGLREAPKFNVSEWLFLMAAVISFGFTIYFALMWRTSLATAYLNGCPGLVAGSAMNAQLSAVTYFFAAGIASLAVVLGLKLWERQEAVS
jgi:hypothetical protein